MSLSLATIPLPAASTNKRKRGEELNGLDDQEDVNDPEVQSIVTTSSSSLTQLILYDTEISLAGAALERLKQHSQFCNSVWNSQFPYGETIQNQLKLNVEELIAKPPWWDKAQWKSIVDFLTVTPKELYRSRPKLLFSFDKWIFVAQLSNYLEANEHLCFAADKLFRFVQQRRWIRGSIWDQLLPIFSKIGL